MLLLGGHIALTTKSYCINHKLKSQNLRKEYGMMSHFIMIKCELRLIYYRIQFGHSTLTVFYLLKCATMAVLGNKCSYL